uniref:F-box associated beta-propeller type 1 domain-containing protein n=1 Tax=Cucumis melo TaxID=3656 RepID=A0A1S4DUI5_CUCME
MVQGCRIKSIPKEVLRGGVSGAITPLGRQTRSEEIGFAFINCTNSGAGKNLFSDSSLFANPVPFSIGFGYDAKSNDFKVVRIVSFRGYSTMVMCPHIRVEIYDLSKDKWREIEAPPFCGDANCTPHFDMYHEGTFYFWGHGESSIFEADHIVTFDMSQEVFSKISVPESYDDKKHKTSLGVLNRSMVLFVYPFESNEKNIDIWEMEKNESSVVSWSKLLTIDPTLGIEHPLLFVSSEELLMESSEGHVIMYNTKTHRFKKLPIEGEVTYTKPNRFEATDLFIKSLVSVEGGRDMINYAF